MSSVAPVPSAISIAKLAPENFRYIAALALRESAILLETGKDYLVETRLAPLALKFAHRDVNAFIAHLRATDHRISDQHLAVVDALTTNETLFFRDVHPFESLRAHVIPKLRAARAAGRVLNIWSAASSTGQEAYSIAMLLAEQFPDMADWNIRIIGTDISPTVLKKARSGIFQQLEVNRGLPASYLVKYFKQEGRNWILSEAIRSRVEFRELNLSRRWMFMPRFDLVLMRNVMIYFELETRRQILGQVRETMAPDGYLLLGTAETAVNIDAAFAPVVFDRSTFFQQSQ